MKNISRRVFIKGMAVAAVATAASTVLAGCNLPATKPEEVPGPVTDNVLSYAGTLTGEEKKKMTFTVTKLTKGDKAFGMEDTAMVSVTVDNQLGNDLKAYASATAASTGITTDGQYGLVVTAYGDRTGDPVTVDNSSNVVNTFTAANDNITVTSIKLTGIEDYSSVTVKVELVKMLDQSKDIIDTVASKKFTYSL